MEEKLKPCPFCGAEGCLRTIHNTSFPLRGKPKEWETYFVNCDNAGCPMNNAQEDGEMGGTLNDWKTKEEAIYAWNTRAPQGWEQVTPDTKFEDGEELLATIRRHHVCVRHVEEGDEFVAHIPVPTSVSVGFRRHDISKFVRLPK